MDSATLLVILVIVVALTFDYINGFHDAANAIATVVATRVLSPGKAVAWAAWWNFASAFTFGTGVASTIGSGLVDLNKIDQLTFLAALIGAIVWDLITWYYGLPSSSSHALIGGLAGAAIAKAGFAAIVWGEKWILTLLFILLAPLLGLALAWILMILIYWIFRHSSPGKMDRWFRWLQLFSSGIFSYSHGTNDAQKTMGIITGAMFTAGWIKSFEVPVWVILSAHAAIALGTMSGGWRIIHTMGGRLTRLKPRSGFCAETAAAISILFSTELKMPVSTTHTITGAIAGVGSIQRFKAVRWGVATNIIWAWVLTIPAAALVGWVTMHAIELVR
ncbi:MAG TPA: inorganic phosphate transporter [Bryobacteraceae bacterium]|nr:inorganic phosphate transporter [Bryobacteraceae bacterium]